MLAQENISFFLAAAADYGVSAHKRFFMLDLWNGNSRPRVVESLAELARVAAAKKFRVPLKVSVLPLEQVPHGISEAQMKELVEQLSRTRVRETGVARKDAPGIFKRKLALLVSQREYPDFERRWTRIQALIRGRAARTKFQSRVLNQAFRDRVAYELRDTEKSYVQSLETCIQRYLTPLRTGSYNKKLVLDKATLKDLFSDLEIIYNVNNVLLTMINKAMENWGPHSQMGSLFVYIMNFLKVYTNYVSVADTQLSTYDNLMKTNKLFSKFCEAVRNGEVDANGHEKSSSTSSSSSTANAANANGAKPEQENKPLLDIPGYLIMPIQRVPRYFMLLERLQKHTWKDHRDYEDLEKSVAGLQAVAQSLNQKKRDFENIRSVSAFQVSIVGCPAIAIPTRSLVKQYEVIDTKKQETFVVLFNDSILLAKTEKKKGVVTHKFKAQYKLLTVDVTVQDDQIEIFSENASVLKLSLSPESQDFATQLPLAKSQHTEKLKKLGHMDDGSALPEHLVSELSAQAEVETMTAEELLKQRENEKRQLRSQMAEDMKVLKSLTMGSQELESASSGSDSGTNAHKNASPSSTTLQQPAGRKASAAPVAPSLGRTTGTLRLNASGAASVRGPSPGPVGANNASPVLRSTASLMKMKAYVEQQISVLDTQFEEEDKKEEFQELARNLNSELAELDQQLEEVKEHLSPEMREAVNQQESEVRLEVQAQDKKTLRHSKKKGRKSFFSFLSSSSSVNSDSPGKDKKTKSGASTPTSPSTPPSSTKVSKSRPSSKSEAPKFESPKADTPPPSSVKVAKS